jgi:hypothetical protein
MEKAKTDKNDETKESELNLADAKVKVQQQSLLATGKELVDLMQANQTKQDGGVYSGTFREALLAFTKLYFALKDGPVDACKDYHRELGLILHSSNTVGLLCRITVDILSTGYRQEDGRMALDQFNPLKNSVINLVNFSDATLEVSEDICACWGFLETLGDKLTEWHPLHMTSVLQVMCVM